MSINNFKKISGNAVSNSHSTSLRKTTIMMDLVSQELWRSIALFEYDST